MHFINDESLSNTAHKPQQQSWNRQTSNKFLDHSDFIDFGIASFACFRILFA